MGATSLDLYSKLRAPAVSRPSRDMAQLRSSRSRTSWQTPSVLYYWFVLTVSTPSWYRAPKGLSMHTIDNSCHQSRSRCRQSMSVSLPLCSQCTYLYSAPSEEVSYATASHLPPFFKLHHLTLVERHHVQCKRGNSGRLHDGRTTTFHQQ